ncbi:MAG: VWA domain-containing protein [Candidatus Hodarchaeales archaeon]
MTREAVNSRNFRAIEIIAESYPRVVAEAIQIEPGFADLILESSSLVFQIKDFFSPQDRELLLKKVIPKLLWQAERIFCAIDRSKYPLQISYHPSYPWNLESSISSFLNSGDPHFTYKHVVCTLRKNRKKSIVLLIDKSHSVLIYLNLIILTSILFSLIHNIDDIAIIGFDSRPEIMKGFVDLQVTTQDVVNRLINVRSGGKTDIYSALKLVEKEFSTRITPKKTLVMISDLLPTSGLDFIPSLERIKDVRIILTPRRQTLQLTAPILGKIRKFKNVKVFPMVSEERFIPTMLKRVLYD